MDFNQVRHSCGRTECLTVAGARGTFSTDFTKLGNHKGKWG